MPGKSLEDIQKSYPDKKLKMTHGAYKTYQFSVEHIRYKFPIFVQTKAGVVTDFFARLPAYFLHDIFHQSLINRYGDQDVYKKVEDQAYYLWKNEKGLKHIYYGACSITCFPVHYAVESTKDKHTGDYQTVFERMEKTKRP
tara:strand:- start:31810 stop:32232 length:423 start_codon:yes stop_codon:yes gene_type:complete